MSVEILSLGCRMNLAESEGLRTLLAGEDDVVVVNSCSVTAEALRQTRQTIRRARRARPSARLLVTGCAVETDRDAVAALGVDGLIANADKLDPRAWNVAPAAAVARSAAYTRAYVAVQNGCDHDCTFCIIPSARGASRSRPVADILREINAHLGANVREVVLTGVDLTSWGHDLGAHLGDLVAAVLREAPDLARLRLSSVDGIEIDPLLFELLCSERRLMPHVHLSLQHGHDLILKRMKRRHARADAVALVAGLRARRPDIAIGADIIAGFPTEEPEHHAANLSIIGELGIVHGHIFPFSPREGTPAARMPQLPRPLVLERAAELRAAVSRTREAWLAGLIGTPQTVLAERDGTGHAENFARVVCPEGTAAGDILTLVPTHLTEGLLA